MEQLQERQVDLVQQIKRNKMMKVLNLEKVAELEKKYQNSGAALTALHNMVNIVSQADTTDYLKDSVAVSTLEEIGVLISATELKQNSEKQLNS